MERNESTIPNQIRQIVFKDNTNLSADWENSQGQYVLMKKPRSVKDFNDQFLARTAYARVAAGKTQAQMAIELGLAEPDDKDAQSKYQKYETRSTLPHHLIAPFCALVDKTTGWLYSGPAVDRPVEKRGRKRKPLARRIA